MTTRSSPRDPTAAESIFVAWLGDPTADIEPLVRANPEHARELRSLHALWLRLEPMLVRAGVRPSDAVDRLRAARGAEDVHVTPLDLASAGGTGSATGELLRRLESKKRATRYRFEGEVARGGMGAILRVWDEDIRRHLAMKVVLGQGEGAKDTPPVDSRLVARFLEEAQITGQLDHPGIVPVHELGLDADGRVYFTMKLVKGRDLGAIYDLVRTRSEGWNQTRALGVLLKVCEAVAFAHAKGVVHRDLKPSNVMVGDFGEVYVMDWGLARVLARDDAAEPQRTRADADAPTVRTDRLRERESSPASSFMTMDGDVVGTPAYMPPEQARGELDALSARSDVYSLGAMLYQLLAGFAPYTAPGEPAGGVAVWKRVLEGPPAPLDSLPSRAPTELVAIQQKAMARDPADRYADVLALAEDLRAFLEGRVVGAFEGGALAEARKWVRRNKGLAAALAAAVFALAAGLVVSLVLSGRVRENAALAEARRVDAERSAEEARRQAQVAGRVNGFLNEDLLASVAPEQRGIDVTVREVLDEASRRLDGRFADEPEIEAALRATIGTSYERLGEYPTARQHLERALELYRSRGESESDAAFQTMTALASVWSRMGLHQESIALHREAIALAERIHGELHEATLSARNDLGIALAAEGRVDDARALYESVLEGEERVLGPDSQQALTTRNNLALLELQAGRFAEAERAFRAVLGRQETVLGARNPHTIKTRANLANTLLSLGRAAECAELCRETLDACLVVNGPDHAVTGTVTAYLGLALVRLGKADEAEPLLERALEIALATRGEGSYETQLARANLAGARAARGGVAEAVELQGDALEVLRRILPPDHEKTLEVMNGLASMYRQLGRQAEAEALFREALEGQRRTLGADHPSTIITLENLANAIFGQGRHAEAAEIVREVLEARRRVLGDAHPDVAKTTFNLGLVTKSGGDPAGALPFLEDARRRSRSLGGDAEPGLLVQCLRTIGDVHAGAKDHAAALASYREALAEHRREIDEDDELSGYLLHQIGVTLAGKQEYPDARTALEEALPLRLRAYGPDGLGTRYTTYSLSKTLLELGLYPESERAALDFHERSLRLRGAEHDETRRARALLADLYARWGKPEEAARWR